MKTVKTSGFSGLVPAMSGGGVVEMRDFWYNKNVD